MEFKTMGAPEYRALDADAFEQRRSAVIAELENPESEVPADALEAEVRCIEQEAERRAAAVSLRNSRAAAVAAGAGAVTAASKPAKGAGVSVTRSEDPFDTEAYNRAFMEFVTRGTEYPAGLVQPGQVPGHVRADAFTQTADVPHFIPTTLSDRIISKMSEYGTIHNKATRLSVQGGLEISVWDYLPTASWVTEDKPADFQKVADASRIAFKYHMLECRVAQSFMSQAVTLEMFQRQYAEKMAEAMVRAVEQAMMNGTGSGQPLGILKDDRLTDDNRLVLAEDAIGTWKGWKSALKQVKAPYRSRGEWVMTQATWDTYVDGMVDDGGQPIARVNYGLSGANDESYRFMGKNVLIVPEDILPNYEDAKGGDADVPCILFGDLSQYLINEQAGMRAVRWRDEDRNLDKQKVQAIMDGRLGDTNGLLVISAPKKGAAAKARAK